MFEIIFGVLVNFFTLSGIFVLWKLVGSVNRKHAKGFDKQIRSGERSAHSNLSLVTIGIASFFFFPLILVGVRWSETGKTIDLSGYLNILGFLLTGVVSYLYFVRVFKGESK